MTFKTVCLPALLLSLFGACAASASMQDAPPAATAVPAQFHQAVELMHSFGGTGDALEKAGQLAIGLKKSYPDAGYAESLQAEAISSQAVQQDGTPEKAAITAIDLADKAIAMNPALALPHIAKARVLVRRSQYDAAAAELDKARALEPDNDSVLFLDADRLRRTDKAALAETQYRKFIKLTPTPQRKSNGYYWLGKNFVEAAQRDESGRADWLAKAKAAFDQMLALDPGSLAKTMNYAVFLNDEGADYGAAEAVASKALAIKDIPMAHHHVAIARYQQLLAGEGADQDALRAKIAAIGKDSGITLDQAIALPDISTAIQLRLLSLKAKL